MAMAGERPLSRRRVSIGVPPVAVPGARNAREWPARVVAGSLLRTHSRSFVRPSPRRVGMGKTGALCGDFALVADWNYGLRVVDIHDPRRPLEVGVQPTPATSIFLA